MTDLHEAITFIRTADENDLAVILEAYKAQARNLQNARTIESVASLNVGDTVELFGLSPKYLNGCTGSVIGKDGTRLIVEFDDQWHNAKPKARYGPTIRVPGGAVKGKEN
jgi:hypothetical protein